MPYTIQNGTSRLKIHAWKYSSRKASHMHNMATITHTHNHTELDHPTLPLHDQPSRHENGTTLSAVPFSVMRMRNLKV